MPHDVRIVRLRDTEFNDIPAINFCVKRLADVQIENQTYIFDISEQTGKFGC